MKNIQKTKQYYISNTDKFFGTAIMHTKDMVDIALTEHLRDNNTYEEISLD